MPSPLVWDETGKRFFETGTDHGVLYVQNNGAYGEGVVWNGLTAVTESPSGAEATDLWADNIKYATLRSTENFGATIEAYQSPEEFDQCDGSAELTTGVSIGQQERKTFGFSYRTKIGSDTDPDSTKNYKIHLVYGATASPSERSYATVNDSPDAITLSWEVTTVPVPVTNKKPTAHLTIDTTRFDAAKRDAIVKAIEDVLYGTDSAAARLPLPDEVASIISNAAK